MNRLHNPRPENASHATERPSGIRTRTKTGTWVKDRYLLEEEIGNGGMSEIRKAHDERTGKDVALKIMHPSLRMQHSTFLYCLKEALIMDEIRVPGVVKLLDYGTHNDRPFIVMERLGGKTLYDLKTDNELTDRDIVEIGFTVASIMAEVHRKGVVHRDLKPENIMAWKDDDIWHVRILDFGLAKASIFSDHGEGMLGTLHFIAPEQTKSADVDRRADIYSLGAILYELFSGKTVFTSDNPCRELQVHEVIELHKESEPKPLSTHRPDLDIRINNLVRRALKREPSQRLQSMDEIRDTLGRYLITTDLEQENDDGSSGSEAG